MSESFSVLVVDDEQLYAQAIGRELERQGLRCDRAFSGGEALQLAGKGRYQVILLDHHLPDEDGLKIIPHLLARQPGTSVIMMTAYQTIPNAVQAIQLGADDYIVKETSIQPIVDRVLEARRRDQLRREGSGWQDHQSAGLLGQSPGIVQVRQLLQQVAKSSETIVLLTGETGVGKEVACRYLHKLSRPEGSPIIVVDCLALPETLAESLMFGHEKGSFTGADTVRVGAFEEARDGTLFLDEIGDVSTVQGKLLRVLETRTFCRVGSTRSIPLKARVVAATNQDLRALVDGGRFRLDLFQRLSVFPVTIPPLRERDEDIVLLAEHFRAFFAGKLGKAIAPLDEPVCQALRRYGYPGNVRELKNIIERGVIVTDSGRLELRHLPPRVLDEQRRPTPPPGASIPFDFVPGTDTLSSLEQRMIAQAMRRAGGVRSEAARLLGISRFQLLRRMEKYGIQPDGDDE